MKNRSLPITVMIGGSLSVSSLGWKCFEAAGVEPVFLDQVQAIDYGGVFMRMSAAAFMTRAATERLRKICNANGKKSGAPVLPFNNVGLDGKNASNARKTNGTRYAARWEGPVKLSAALPSFLGPLDSSKLETTLKPYVRINAYD